MKVSVEWLTESAAAFRASAGRVGYAQLKHYTAEYCEWGDGPPVVLVPGLAGGYELLGPLARLLAHDFRVISFQLRGEDDCFVLRRRFELADLVADLAEFLDWHCLESPALCGVSFGGVLALFSLLRAAPPAYPMIFCVGAVYFAVITSLSTVLQQDLDDRVRGKVMDLWIMGFGGTVPFGGLLGGRIADATSVTTMVLGGAVVAVGLGLVMTFRPGAREDDGAGALSSAST